MKDSIIVLIPTYPEAVSDVVLAAHTGFIQKPYSWRRIKRGIKKLSARLSWEALKNPNLMNRVESLQPSTLEYLEENDLADIAEELTSEAEEYLFSYYFFLETN